MERLFVELVEKTHESYHIEYGGFLSNHMMHGLVANLNLNVSKERLQEWFDWYAQHKSGSGAQLEPPIPPKADEEVTAENWRVHLGERRSYSSLYNFFAHQIKEKDDADLVLREYLPVLSRGLIGSALHPLIHIGFALAVDKSLRTSDGTQPIRNIPLAEGLAYMVHSYLELDPADQLLEAKDSESGVSEKTAIEQLVDILSSLHADEELREECRRKRGEEGGFQQRVKHILNLPKVHSTILNAVQNWKVNSVEEASFAVAQASAMVLLFDIQPAADFFFIHGVTSCFALLQILPHLHETDRMPFLRHYLTALVVVFLGQGCPDILGGLAKAGSAYSDEHMEPSWEDILSRVTDVGAKRMEEHVLKLTYACSDFDKRFAEKSLFYPKLFKKTADVLTSYPIYRVQDYNFNSPYHR